MSRGFGPVPHVENRDCQSLEDAFQRYQPELLGALRSMLGNLHDAHDALQEAFVKCWQHRDELAEIHNLKAWIFRVTLNTARDMRGTAWNRKRQGLAGETEKMADKQPAPEDQVVASEEWELIRAAVRNLSPEEQEVFLLRQNAGLTYDEIAVALEIPVGTVKTRMRRALLHIRNQVERTLAGPP
ncbi:MAG: sigma-24 [Pirellulaceae bacterium]|nr:MAG: sigma-24 [Pirellulaceae bacterium]